MHLLVVELGDVLQRLFDPWIEVLLSHVGQHVRLHDADIDATQIQDVGDILERAFSDDREHPQRLAIVQHRRQVGGDPHIGSVPRHPR